MTKAPAPPPPGSRLVGGVSSVSTSEGDLADRPGRRRWEARQGWEIRQGREIREGREPDEWGEEEQWEGQGRAAAVEGAENPPVAVLPVGVGGARLEKRRAEDRGHGARRAQNLRAGNRRGRGHHGRPAHHRPAGGQYRPPGSGVPGAERLGFGRRDQDPSVTRGNH